MGNGRGKIRMRYCCNIVRRMEGPRRYPIITRQTFVLDHGWLCSGRNTSCYRRVRIVGLRRNAWTSWKRLALNGHQGVGKMIKGVIMSCIIMGVCAPRRGQDAIRGNDYDIGGGGSICLLITE